MFVQGNAATDAGGGEDLNGFEEARPLLKVTRIAVFKRIPNYTYPIDYRSPLILRTNTMK